MFALRELAVTCKFGVLHDEMIRDQLIEKTAFVRVRDRLLEEEKDSTHEKALLLASRIEDVARDSAAIGAAAGSLRDTMSGGTQQHGVEPGVTGG